MAPSLRQIQVLQGISFAVTLWAIFFLNASAVWWLVAVGVYFLTGCLGLTIGLHRSISHRAVTFPKGIEYAFAWLGTVGGSGSAIAFASMHRAHHAYGDTDKDPHCPDRLGWWILITEYDFKFEPRLVKDLFRDPFHVFVQRYHTPLLIAWAFALWLIDPLLVVFGFFVPVFLQITLSNLTNIIGHSTGYRGHETRDTSFNNWIIALVTWGEGWHNNHHARPTSPYLQDRWWEVDPGGTIIALMVRMGLATTRS